MASQRDDGSSDAGAQGDRDLAQPTVVSAAISTPAAAASSDTDSAKPVSGGSSQEATTRSELDPNKPQIVATLTAIDGDLKGEAFVLQAGENHLGRGVDCSPVLNSRWISRSHATLVCDNGQMSIRATEGKEIAVNDVTTTEQALHDGDLVRMGTTVLILRTVAPGEYSGSSVIPVATEGSGEQKVPSAVNKPAPASAAAPAATSAPSPARRKKSWWKFWAKPSPSLVFIRGSRSGERINLTGARVRIGGLQDNEIVISGNDASRNHAELRVREGRVHIWDLRSVNGTWVNDERIENKELRFGDVIRIGSEELRFED